MSLLPPPEDMVFIGEQRYKTVGAGKIWVRNL